MSSFVWALAFASQASATPFQQGSRAPFSIVAVSHGLQLAQAAATPSTAPNTETTPATPSPDAALPDATAPPPPEPIGTVAKLTGSATLVRDNQSYALSLQDDIYKNDVLRTGTNSALDITFNDATTFSMTSNSSMTIDEFVYAEGGSGNAALFDIARGTVAFVAAAVAKTGDMKIATPTASLGIRGTSGVVEVPEQRAGAAPRNVAIKLYPDADGKVGRIEVNGRDGSRLGLLSQGATGFAIRPGMGAGARFAAVPLLIPPQQVLRDRGIVTRVHSAQIVGRQIVTQRRNDLRNGLRSPGQQRQPGLQRLPGSQRQNGIPRPGLQRPGGAPPQPGLQRQNNLQQRQPGPQRPGAPRQGTLPPMRQNAVPAQPGLQRQGAPAMQQRLPGQFRQAPARALGPLRTAPRIAPAAHKRRPDEVR